MRQHMCKFLSQSMHHRSCNVCVLYYLRIVNSVLEDKKHKKELMKSIRNVKFESEVSKYFVKHR